MTQLIPIENVNAIELFKSEKTLTELLGEIKKTATDFKPDTSTEKGRKEIASQAYKVSQSKTVIDAAGKDLTAEWLRKKKEVDAGRKTARDFCDNLRDEIRQPLTEWEDEEKKLAVIAAQKAETEADELEAYAENDLFDRERRLLAAEAEIAAKEEAARMAQEEQDAEDRRIATEKRLKAEADERAKREAEESIERERQKVIEAERATREQAKHAERDRIAAQEREQARIEADKQREIEAARQAERDKLQAIKDTEIRIEHDRIEAERIAGIERQKEERKANQKRHVSRVNKSVVDSLIANGIAKATANKVVELVACEAIDNIRIEYLTARLAA